MRSVQNPPLSKLVGWLLVILKHKMDEMLKTSKKNLLVEMDIKGF